MDRFRTAHVQGIIWLEEWGTPRVLKLMEESIFGNAVGARRRPDHLGIRNTAPYSVLDLLARLFKSGLDSRQSGSFRLEEGRQGKLLALPA
jgi:hypothetical protein